ncbi:uncharacterized protein (TIGR03083 family) [Micromonospora kangleipakensis]|uniref:Uncharacterized protein (TIGR03083 family) n=1 Tax=Micromonospora kangleipakensis TaxID=1077942 RepID=A0A4Q8B5S5_9ACTN|nr:maleylpyruvate isomerase family mycothiol-dependent enzyme [Micromonospora kangleipakensis]RZU72213.1 uncharacterized protein (TIGR03083 family) [Micromonospora kangleipakensis]
MNPVDTVAAAYGESLQQLLTLGEQLDGPAWAARTQCPLWSVADVYAHITGPEAWLAGGAEDYVVPTQEWIDSHVRERRGRPPTALLAELRDLLPVRLRQLAGAAQQPTVFIPRLHAVGPHELGLRFRVFDLWTHEQDVREAVGRPGNLGTDSARITQELLILSLPRSVAKLAGAPPGSTVRITAHGELPADVCVQVGADGRGSLLPAGSAADPDVHLTLSWASFARLGAGRGAVSDHEVSVSGDGGLAQRVLEALNVAP